MYLKNTFDYINSILYKKELRLLEGINFDQEFQPYLIQRWLSMYSPEICNILNETSNKQYGIFENKEMWFDYFDTIIPKMKYSRLEYIKKVNKKAKRNKEDDKIIEFLAKNSELSQREIKQMVDEFNLDVSIVKKVLKE